MMTESATDAVDLAFELDQNNQERQKMTEGLVKKAIEQVEKDQKNNPMLFVLGQQWSSGIVGLIAGKIKEKYYKPTIVMVQNGNEIMGSGRSIEGFNLIESLQELSHFFSKFGGHPMACGFTLKDSSKLELFKNSLMNLCKQKTDGKLVEPTILIDAEIDLDEVDWELYNTLAKFEPFGQMNESPKYLAKGLTIQSMKALGKDSKHLRIMVKHNNHRVRKTIGWNLCNGNGNNTNWCNLLKPGDVIDMVFEISLNEWNGTKELQMTIVDLKKQ
jgi:single-stranded-DNA-specific exonuclease